MAGTTSEPLRLVFVTSGLARGGAETFLVRLTLELSRRGHECSVSSLDAGGALSDELAAGGIAVVDLGGGSLASSLRLARWLRERSPDAVQGWMYRGNLVATAAAAIARAAAPVVWSIRQGLNDLDVSPRATRLAISTSARLSRRPAAVVYNAESARRQHEAIGFAPRRSVIIPNGIGSATAAPAALDLPDGAFVVALIARWHPVKNHEGFVRAAARFARTWPAARFVLAGDGIDAGNRTLASWIESSGIGERVTLLGERSDVASILAAADVVTLSSHGEAFPNVILEGMAAGKSCVAPDVGDVAALLGDAGVLVRPGDPEALAAGWESIASMTAAAREALGAKARRRAIDIYGLERAGGAFEALYRSLLG
jgi:glycosyltransferase involved in cell wall biosynthesis